MARHLIPKESKEFIVKAISDRLTERGLDWHALKTITSPAMVHRIKNLHSRFSKETLEKIANFLGVSPSYMIYKDESREVEYIKAKINIERRRCLIEYNRDAFGLRLEKLRLKAGLTQRGLSRSLGYNSDIIAKLESAVCGVTLLTLTKLAEVFRVSENWLLHGDHGKPITTAWGKQDSKIASLKERLSKLNSNSAELEIKRLWGLAQERIEGLPRWSAEWWLRLSKVRQDSIILIIFLAFYKNRDKLE